MPRSSRSIAGCACSFAILSTDPLAHGAAVCTQDEDFDELPELEHLRA